MLDPGGTQPRTALYGPDGWHLSAAGNAVLADAIRPALVAP
jgi:lysophospholipase L1-like esterase